MDILAVKRGALDLAGVAAVALHGINIGSVCSDHKAHMVGTAAVPVEKDHITGGYIRIIACRPLPVFLEPGNTLGGTGSEPRLAVSCLVDTLGNKTGAPFHTAVKSIPGPVRLSAYISHLGFCQVNDFLIAQMGAVYKLHAA